MTNPPENRCLEGDPFLFLGDFFSSFRCCFAHCSFYPGVAGIFAFTVVALTTSLGDTRWVEYDMWIFTDWTFFKLWDYWWLMWILWVWPPPTVANEGMSLHVDLLGCCVCFPKFGFFRIFVLVHFWSQIYRSLKLSQFSGFSFKCFKSDQKFTGHSLNCLLLTVRRFTDDCLQLWRNCIISTKNGLEDHPQLHEMIQFHPLHTISWKKRWSQTVFTHENWHHFFEPEENRIRDLDFSDPSLPLVSSWWFKWIIPGRNCLSNLGCWRWYLKNDD